MPRPRKVDKKDQVNVKLPPWLLDWMTRQPESNARLIETAQVSHFQIPEAIKPPSA